MTTHTFPVTVELEVMVTAKATYYKGCKQTLYEPGERAGYELESYTVAGKGIRQQIHQQVDSYLHDEWEGIDQEMCDADQAAYDDYKFEQWRDRQLEA